MSFRAAVVTFPGSNCDRDMAVALETVSGNPALRVWHGDADLPERLDLIALPGGFSYGDYLRSGAMAANSPIMRAIIAAAQRGVPVLGVCNGFQVLTEARMLPGALLHNANRKFVCKNVHLIPQSKIALPTAKLDHSESLQIPIAHGEGNYYAPQSVLDELNANDQVLFRYCDINGDVTEEANPNGSIQNIAGVMNKKGNVFGMMPHPERAADLDLTNIDGRSVFESILGLVAH